MRERRERVAHQEKARDRLTSAFQSGMAQSGEERPRGVPSIFGFLFYGVDSD